MFKKTMKGAILYVEDEFGEALTEALEDANYYVIRHRNGRKAIYEIQNDLRYDLAIVDLSLPMCGGDEVISASKEKNPQVPVLCLSALPYSKKSDYVIGKTMALPSEIVEIVDSFLSNK